MPGGLSAVPRFLMFGVSETKRTTANLQAAMTSASLADAPGQLHFSQRPSLDDGLLPNTRLLGSRAGWWDLTELGTQLFWAFVIMAFLCWMAARHAPHRSQKAGQNLVRYLLCFFVCYQWYWVTRVGIKVPASSYAAHQFVRWECINSDKGGKSKGNNDDWNAGWRDCAQGQPALCTYDEPCTPCNGHLFGSGLRSATRDDRVYSCTACPAGALAGDTQTKCAAELAADTGAFLGPFCNYSCTSDAALLGDPRAGFGGRQHAACDKALAIASRGVPADVCTGAPGAGAFDTQHACTSEGHAWGPPAAGGAPPNADAGNETQRADTGTGDTPRYSWVVAPCEYCCRFGAWPPPSRKSAPTPRPTKAPTDSSEAVVQHCPDPGFPVLKPGIGCCPKTAPADGGYEEACGRFKCQGAFEKGCDQADPNNQYRCHTTTAYLPAGQAFADSTGAGWGYYCQAISTKAGR